MLGNILFVSFVIFSIFEFFEGIRMGIENPFFLFSGVLSLILFYLLIKLAGDKFDSGISINKNSLINRIKENQVAKIITVIILWILAIGNFAYANNWKGAPISSGAEYLDAAILTIISYVILNKDIKKV